MKRITVLRTPLFLALGLCFLARSHGLAQVDPEHRNLLELGYDGPIGAQGPQGVYAYYYYNQPHVLSTNVDLRLAIAPVYVDGELGLKRWLSPITDIGFGFSGGAFGDNYYDVQQGNYLKNESFNGSGGGASLSVYQLLNPGVLIPVSVIVRGGGHYTAYMDTANTAANFDLPGNQTTAYTLTGIRMAGKEPNLYPDLGLELSVWFERQWRFNSDTYGFNNDRHLNPNTDLYWLYAGLNYAWTNSGQMASLAVTAGGSTDADPLTAFRLGGVLPLVAEYPLTLPGYFYEELTVTRFTHIYTAYNVPLESEHRLLFRVEAATAHLEYLPGFEQRTDWQTGVGCGLTFAPRNRNFKVVLRYGYGFNAIRNGQEGAHSVGLLFQYDFEAHKKKQP
jgi:hypothetical protein